MNAKPRSLIRTCLLVARPLAVAVLCVSFITACRPQKAGSDTLARIQQEKVLRVAYINYPPSAFRDPATGQMTGHFVDMLRELTQTLNPQIKLEFIETNWADFASILNSGRADLSICGTFTTIPRAKLVTFTRPIVYLGRGAIVRRDDTRWRPDLPVSQFDRPDIKVGVVNGEGSYELAKATFKNTKNIVVFDGGDLSQCLAAVSAGQVDVGLSDSLETSKYASVHTEVVDVYKDNPQDVMPIAWSVRHDDLIWKNFLDTALTTLESQGKMRRWEAAYGFKWTKPALDLKPRF
jgi:ABC-type amino acid transport substrate-binding protein